MSIVAYFARLTTEQLATCLQEPQALASMSLDHLPGAEAIDIDRAWEPMAWLVSPLKRAEHQHNAMVMSDALTKRRQPKPTLLSRITGVFKTNPSQDIEDTLHESLKQVDAIPLDLPLAAIEGRTETRDERINFGMGPAAIFSPEEVSRLHKALTLVEVAHLEREVQPALMDSLGVFPAHWAEEDRELMENYIVPNFLKLREFYARASTQQQTVVMWYV